MTRLPIYVNDFRNVEVIYSFAILRSFYCCWLFFDMSVFLFFFCFLVGLIVQFSCVTSVISFVEIFYLTRAIFLRLNT